MSLKLLLTDPERFLSGNILIPPSAMSKDSSDHTKSGLFQAWMVKSDKQAEHVGGGGPIGAYRFENDGKWIRGPSETLTIFYCHYDPDQLHMMVIDDDADLMLTPKMDGCSFGVGPANKDHAHLVGHINISRTQSSAAGARDQSARQVEVLRSALTDRSDIMSQGSYAPFGSGQTGATIGVRDASSGRWRFYTQMWKLAAGRYYLCSPPFITITR